MTQNQLKYWELRWKQYYEYYYLQETKRSNMARELETARHNRVQERISKQELVLRRIELSQNQEKIVQQWKNLELTEQATMIKAALELRNQDRLANEFLQSQKMAAASMIVQYNNEQEKRQIEKFNAYVQALDTGWTKTAVAKVLTEIESSNDEVNRLLTDVAKQYNLDIEVKGPQGIGAKIKTSLDKSNDDYSNTEHAPWTDKNGFLKPEYKTGRNKVIMDKMAREGLGYKDALEKYGPALGLGGKTSVTGGIGYSGGIQSPSTNAPTTGTSGVIYSGGRNSLDTVTPLTGGGTR